MVRWGNWEVDISYNGLRFFAQLSEELLYYFSHDSFKVPTLNFHYLCFEALSIIENIELGTLDKGNIVPELQEFIHSYKNDPIICSFYGEDINILFTSKDATGEFKNTLNEIMQTPTSDASIQKFKKCLLFLQDDLARNSRYYNKGISEIKKYILKPNLEQGELELLQQYTKIILTELINMGYSQEYIYTTTKKVFFGETSPIDNVEETFDKFIGFFSLRKRQYVVYLPLNNIKAKEELLVFNGLSIEANVFEMFENTCSYVIKLEEKAMDPEEAKTEAVGLIDFGLSVSQYCRHNKRTYLFKCAEIVDLETHEVYHLKSLAQPISRQQRTHIRANKLIRACFSLESGIFTAINLHASAFETRNIKNQLLNLWTAMEVLIPVERSGSLSRINQISNYAATILSSHYINMLLSHLDSQVSEMLGSKYAELVNAVDGKFQNAEKLLALLILPEYDRLFAELLPMLNDTPLLKFKLQQYKNIFSYGPHIAEFYKRHAKRVTWQIMRIYRNRNMIVHDGSTLPFLDVILQNLHFYIDTIIDRFCDMSEHGFKDASSVIVQLTQNERKYLSQLSSQKTYCKADFLEVLGNGI